MGFLQKWSKSESLSESGLFKAEGMNIDLKTGKGSYRITQSFIGETYGQTNRPVYDSLTGFFVGVLELLTGNKLTGEEITCIAKGNPYCTFKFESVE